MAELAASKVKKLLSEDSEGIRVSAGAIPVATTIAADFLRQLGMRAASIARANGRKTIMEEDVESAKKQVWI